MNKQIIFDFDGTLVDTFDVIKNIVINEYGEYDIDFELFKHKGAKGLLKKANIPRWKLPGMILNVTSKLRKSENIKLFPGIVDLLYSLKSNYKIGIVSSNSKDIIIDTLKKDNIENLFEFVYSESSLFGKHLVLKKMCKKHNINPLDVIYVGDEDRDIIAAKKAGIKNIAVTWGFNSKEKLSRENPDYLVDSPMQILEVLPQK
ncbi:MAG: HAD-IA family hydrolase [Dysgonamonadaceae bacterium]|nr:HAD-IA family hydrolase [Dysgonamonadaceae bacterium]MDD3355393.1 HAD-IA family hydrolase [Dysgonamonadaceae bacterium]MDD3727658.1 HAD-IA family hydrolase [Dysgonamonadaceae bacterium]MDD4246765.1 HAD-IA family hydrolase [Dysgonamonadaceae bacterium]MDD4605236.1 HAD-IA family hydrolase [Dysgonamonadaceae bacterium]